MLTVKEFAKKWNVSERTARNYCSSNKINNAYQKGGTWFIPEDAILPERVNGNKKRNFLLEALRLEKKDGIKGRIYHRLQIDLTFNSNHIEGSRLTHDETRFIFETRTIGIENKTKVRPSKAALIASEGRTSRAGRLSKVSRLNRPSHKGMKHKEPTDAEVDEAYRNEIAEIQSSEEYVEPLGCKKSLKDLAIIF